MPPRQDNNGIKHALTNGSRISWRLGAHYIHEAGG